MLGVRAAAATLCVLAYAGTLRAPFVYDDFPYVAGNPDLSGGFARLGELFHHAFPSSAPERGLYRPLTAATYLLERGGGPADPVRSHAANLVLAGLLVLAAGAALGRVLSPGAAAAGTVLFAVHPVHTEAIAWVTGRSELLAGLLACLAFAWSLDYLSARGGMGRLFAAASALGLGMLAKENAIVTLPLVALAAGFPERRRDGSRTAWTLGVLSFVVALAVAARFAALGALVPSAGERVAGGDLLDRAPLIMAAAGEHLRLLAWPHPLHVERMHDPPHAFADLRVLAGFLVLAAQAALLLALRRRPPQVLLAVWPLVALLPVLHLIPIGETVAERFLLLPSVGFCGLLGWFLVAPGRVARVRLAALGALTLAGLLGCVAASRTWSSEAALWRNAVANAPGSATGWAGLGDAYARAGNPEAAVPAYRHALQIGPGLTTARLALANALESTGDLEGALRECRAAVSMDPSHAPALNNLGARLVRAGERAEAARLFRRAVEISPRYGPALRNAAVLAEEDGRLAEAQELLSRARAVDPALPGLDALAERLAARPSPGAPSGR